MKLIVLDPGHGGVDSGAIGNGYEEKSLNLIVALYTAGIIHEMAPKLAVAFTRSSDNTLSLNARTSFANLASADLFVSIHFNAGGGSGFETFKYPETVPETSEIQKKIHSVLAPYYEAIGLPNRGMKQADFHVLRETNMPAILIECAFIDSAYDMSKIMYNDGLYNLATRIARGVIHAAA